MEIIEFQISCIIFWGVLYQSKGSTMKGGPEHILGCAEHILGYAISIKRSYNGRGSRAGHLAAHEVAAPGNF